MYMNDSHEELQLLVKSYKFWFESDSIILEITNIIRPNAEGHRHHLVQGLTRQLH
jgi:hypothetical protein